MKLLLDIGNTSVNWAIAKEDEFIATGAFGYAKHDLGQSLKENLLKQQKPTHVLVANVAGDDVFNSLATWVMQEWQLECWQAHVSKNFNALKNSYSKIEQMGVDRWLAMVAAWEKYKSALFITGCGTALTIDVIDAEGNHLGGYIVPGIELMQTALVERTERINSSPGYQASLDYANDTQAAINNGAFLAGVAAIESALAKFSSGLKTRPKCIISGGMAESINPLLKKPFEHDANLVLSGLLTTYKASS